MELLTVKNAKQGQLIKWYSQAVGRWLVGVVTNTHRTVKNHATGQWGWDKRAVEILLNGEEIIFDIGQNDEVYLLEEE